MLNFDQLQIAVAAAKRRFALIRKKYPELKARLVLSLPGGQAGLDSSPADILDQFPAMMVDDNTKASALLLRESLDWEVKVTPETARQKEGFNQLTKQLQYDEQCQIEIRFDELSYDLVGKLQGDELVDRDLTPQTKASIQIVLGTLAHFLNEYEN